MKCKIFVSINIPDKTRKQLIKTTEKWQDLPMKWVKEANLHITLLFLGYMDEEMIPEICQKVRDTADSEDIFDIEFDKIELFPSAADPKMIAVTGPANSDLLRLNEKLERQLDIFTSAKKSFRPHITLGRTRMHKWEALDLKPEITEKYPLTVSVETVDVMASDFGDGQNEYTIIESCPLK